MGSEDIAITARVVELQRLTADDVLISPVTVADLQSLAEGYYASFPRSFHDNLEPPSKSSAPELVRAARFAKRMEPWLASPDGKWMKATLRHDPQQQVIGHAGWLRPVSPEGRRHVIHHWRRDAVERLGWKELMGWSDEELEEMWEHVDLEAWQKSFVGMDEVREKRMWGIRHWFVCIPHKACYLYPQGAIPGRLQCLPQLAPLWVLPEYQGRGVASLLLNETLELADANPPTAAYLETMPTARNMYEHFGFKDVPGYDIQMVRCGPVKKT